MVASSEPFEAPFVKAPSRFISFMCGSYQIFMSCARLRNMRLLSCGANKSFSLTGVRSVRASRTIRPQSLEIISGAGLLGGVHGMQGIAKGKQSVIASGGTQSAKTI